MEPLRLPIRQTEHMHGGRISIAGARYFVTLVIKGRHSVFADPKDQAEMLTIMRLWHEESQGWILAATVMPDHIHVLFELGAESTLGQTIGRWKAEARKRTGYAWAFQRDFWEHRLREAENVEDYAVYIFLNPYRAGLLAATETWPGWYAPKPEYFRFAEALDVNGAPPPEWIEWPDVRFSALAHGE